MGVSTLGHPETQKPPLGWTSQQHRSYMVSCLPQQALPSKASGRLPGPSGPQGLGAPSGKPALTLLTCARSPVRELQGRTREDPTQQPGVVPTSLHSGPHFLL